MILILCKFSTFSFSLYSLAFYEDTEKQFQSQISGRIAIVRISMMFKNINYFFKKVSTFYRVKMQKNEVAILTYL